MNLYFDVRQFFSSHREVKDTPVCGFRASICDLQKPLAKMSLPYSTQLLWGLRIGSGDHGLLLAVKQ